MLFWANHIWNFLWLKTCYLVLCGYWYQNLTVPRFYLFLRGRFLSFFALIIFIYLSLYITDSLLIILFILLFITTVSFSKPETHNSIQFSNSKSLHSPSIFCLTEKLLFSVQKKYFFFTLIQLATACISLRAKPDNTTHSMHTNRLTPAQQTININPQIPLPFFNRIPQDHGLSLETIILKLETETRFGIKGQATENIYQAVVVYGYCSYHDHAPTLFLHDLALTGLPLFFQVCFRLFELF